MKEEAKKLNPYLFLNWHYFHFVHVHENCADKSFAKQADSLQGAQSLCAIVFN